MKTLRDKVLEYIVSYTLFFHKLSRENTIDLKSYQTSKLLYLHSKISNKY